MHEGCRPTKLNLGLETCLWPQQDKWVHSSIFFLVSKRQVVQRRRRAVLCVLPGWLLCLRSRDRRPLKPGGETSFACVWLQSLMFFLCSEWGMHSYFLKNSFDSMLPTPCQLGYFSTEPLLPFIDAVRFYSVPSVEEFWLEKLHWVKPGFFTRLKVLGFLPSSSLLPSVLKIQALRKYPSVFYLDLIHRP